MRGEFYPEDFLIPFAARHMGRPVKWTEDRRDHLMSSNHARDVECTLEIACMKDGLRPRDLAPLQRLRAINAAFGLSADQLFTIHPLA